MKHGSLISPDEATFGLGTSKAVFEATSATHGDGGDCITVPDAHLLFSGEFKHVGNDLKIIGEDGKSFLVTDYFKADKHPSLRSPEGATLTGDLVDLLAGPLAPGQYAQAGAPQPGTAEAVGRVAVVTGNVTVIRNGVAITVNAGDAILKNDVVQTGAGATCGVAFNDGSTFNIAASARLAINEFVYDPNGSANASLVTLIQGAATFVAGQIAKTGDMKVATPVATMGIRGTAVILDTNALDGRVTISVIDQRDNKDHSVEVYDRAGNLIATATSFGGRLVLTPTTTLDVIASFTNKTVEQIAVEFAAFQAVLSSYEAAKQFFPNLPDHTDASPKNIQHADGTQLQPSEGGSKTLPDSPTFGDKVVVTEVVITKTTDSSTTGDDKDIDTDNHTVDPPPPPPPPFTVIVGTPGDDILTGTAGPDRIFAGPGNDTIVAGHGGGDDRYDGGTGDGDLIKFPSADALQPLVFHLHGITADNTVDGPLTGHDIFTNIEQIESGAGDDVFNLYANDNWHIDAGEGIDTVVFVGDLSIGEEVDGPDIVGIEIIDLNTTHNNAVHIDGTGAIEAIYGPEHGGDGDTNDTENLTINGGPGDRVNLVNDNQDGEWHLVSTGPVYALYVFDDGDNEAQVYIHKDIIVDIIENVTVNVATPDGYDLDPDQLYTDMAGSEVDQYTASATQFTAFNEETGLTFVVTGTGLTYEIDGDDHFQITGGFITGINIYDDGENLLVETDGFNFDAAAFNLALNTYRDSDFTDSSGLDAIFKNVSYDFTGNNGEDHLEGGAFADKFNGAGGDNEFTGNGGADTFVVHGAGHTTVTDFSISGGDRIDVSGFSNLHHMTDIGPLAHQDGLDTVIEFDNGDVLTLKNVVLNNLTDNDFLFANGPILDLDANDSSGVTGSGYQTTVTLGGAAVPVLDSDAAITEASSLKSATILLTGEGNGGYTDYGADHLFIDVSQLEGATGNNTSGSWQGITWGVSSSQYSIRLTLTGEGSAAEYLELLQAARMQIDSGTGNTGANVAITVNSDDGSTSATTAVQFTTPNEAPIANNDEATTTEDHAAIDIHVAQNDSDDSGGSLIAANISTLSNPSLGTLQYISYGDFTFTPAANASGTTTFTYQAFDGELYSDTVTVTINVAPDADAPALSVIPDATPSFVTDEFQVNSSSGTGYSDSRAVVTALSDGGFVVTWNTFGQDGDAAGISGRLFDADGVAVGEDFQISTYTTDDQQRPSVAALEGGGFVVVWESHLQEGEPSSHGYYGVYGQIFGPNGNTIVSEIHLNTYTAEYQIDPTVVGLADGGFVATWSSLAQDGDGAAVVAQRYDAVGQKVGLEFVVNETTSGDQSVGSIAATADGGFVITWSHNAPDSPGVEIYGQRFDADGNRAGDEFHVNTYTAGHQIDPSVAVLSDGGFVIVWQSYFAQEGSDSGIFAQRYSADGTALGGEMHVNTYTDSDQWGPTVAALPDGGFLVTWESRGQDGDGSGVYGQAYTAQGAKVGEEFLINQTTTGDQEVGRISSGNALAVLASGEIVQVWSDSPQFGSNDQIYARLFEPAPFAVGNEDSTINVALITAALADTDGSQTLTLVLSGFPENATFSKGTLDTDSGSSTFGKWLITDSSEIASLATTTLRMTPPQNYNGSFQLTVAAVTTDTAAGLPSDTATTTTTIDINVAAVNDAPVQNYDLGNVGATTGVEFSVQFDSDTFIDIDSSLDYAATLENGDPLPDWLAFDSGTLTFSGTPPTADAFNVKVTASDGEFSISDTFSLTVSDPEVPNQAPMTGNASAHGNEDPVMPIPIELFGLDFEGPLSAFRITGAPEHGALYSDADGTMLLGNADILLSGIDLATIYFKPDAGWNGETILHYAAVDSNGLEDPTPASYTIVVGAINDAPVISIDNADTAEFEGSTTLTGLSVSDADDDELQITFEADHGTLQFVDSVGTPAPSQSFSAIPAILNPILGDGITYTPPALDPENPENTELNDKVTLTVEDGHGGTDTVNFIFSNYIIVGETPTLTGTTGKDVIFSTGTSDDLTGNGGNDAFVFSFYEGQIGSDTIADFHAGSGADMDKIFLDGAPFSTFEELESSITYNDDTATATIDLGTDGTIVLANIDQPLTANNFIIQPFLT